MKLWLSRQHDGRYMLTALRPVKANVGRTGIVDLYAKVGDPVVDRHLCPWGTDQMFPGAKLEPLESVRVEVIGKVLRRETTSK